MGNANAREESFPPTHSATRPRTTEREHLPLTSYYIESLFNPVRLSYNNYKFILVTMYLLESVWYGYYDHNSLILISQYENSSL